MSLQYLKKEVKGEVVFFHADRHFEQADFNPLGIKFFFKVTLSLIMGLLKHFRRSQSNKFATSLQYLKKEVRDGVDFCIQISIKVPTNHF